MTRPAQSDPMVIEACVRRGKTRHMEMLASAENHRYRSGAYDGKAENVAVAVQCDGVLLENQLSYRK